MQRRTNHLIPSIFAAACALVAVFAAACGGDGGDDGLGGSTPPVEGGDVMAIERGVEQRMTELRGQPRDQIEREMHTWLDATHAFEAVGVGDDGNVWARFPNGELLIAVTNRPGITAEDEGGDGAIGELRQELRAALPGTTSAFVGNTLAPPRFAPAADEIRGWATGNGYVDGGGDASVEGVAHVPPASGLFYVDSHGGEGEARSGEEIYGIWTTTRVTERSLDLYERERIANELVIMVADPGNGPDEARFAFTGKLVRARMTFASDAVVFINACRSDHESMRSAFLAVGAGAYLGWRENVSERDAVRVGRLVMDRALGSNAAYIDARERRPFDLDGIQEELRVLGWNPVTTSSPSSPGVHERDIRNIHVVSSGPPRVLNELVFTKADPTVAYSLAPSLAGVVVNEAAQTLTATGHWGAGADRITLGGYELSIVSSSSNGSFDVIVADLAGAPFSGAVVVESYGRRSNRKTLAEWTMHVQWTRSFTTPLGSYAYDADCELSFRAMPRGARPFAGSDAIAPLLVDRIDLSTRSRCRLGASGRETWSTGDASHLATWEPARTDAISAPELASATFTYLQLGMDGAWTLAMPLSERDVVRRTIDGTPALEPMSAGIMIGDADGGRFDVDSFTIPGGDVTHGDTHIRWESAIATPTVERGEGFTR